MILAKIWKYKRTQTIINKWTCCHLPGCRTPSHFGLCHWGGQCSPAKPKKQTVTSTPKQRTWTPPHERTARVHRKPCHSVGVAFGHGEKGKRRRESKPKCGIWRVCVCMRGRAHSCCCRRLRSRAEQRGASPPRPDTGAISCWHTVDSCLRLQTCLRVPISKVSQLCFYGKIWMRGKLCHGQGVGRWLVEGILSPDTSTLK